ncbi:MULTISPECIES: GntR family transcriptional regulator [Pseudovibrio]|uniref:GntR family transcriptional regulator n=1 Tax=Stappiaceae TaxID=2821832 RepID=UPI002365E7B9|nr:MULTISPECIES: GntR family transcriptional regulator [Pseudovibrio]MDD7911750.1 GntR family transcriptional regulator [Pseudovibrio exalbescens]MDX5594801.1 GntR family transcriptional regulator [Pseudovibrio sp. SPO723]
MSINAPEASGIEPIELSPSLPLPLYLQLAKHLRNQITSGKLAEYNALPGERELAETFGVSRVTVRKALSSLTAEGLLNKRQGSGWFINNSPHVEQRLSALTSFTEDMSSRGLQSGTVWLGRSISHATPEEALALNLRPREEVVRLNRLRLADTTPLAIELSVVPTKFLPDPFAFDGSLYQHLRNLGHAPHRALQRLSAVRLIPDLARQLELPEGAPALYIERRTFLENGTPLEFVASHYRGDAYDFVVELTLT